MKYIRHYELTEIQIKYRDRQSSDIIVYNFRGEEIC